MLRIITTLLILGASLSASLGTAAAQIGQFPGVAPSVPSPQLNGAPLLGGAPAPPQVMPGPTVSPGYRGTSQIYTTRRGRVVQVPAGPPNRQSFSDRVERCMEAGAAAGLGPNHVSSFSRRCAN
jgi:hypothetical protein